MAPLEDSLKATYDQLIRLGRDRYFAGVVVPSIPNEAGVFIPSIPNEADRLSANIICRLKTEMSVEPQK